MSRETTELDPVIIQLIVDTYNAGTSVKDLSEQLSLTPVVVRRTLKDAKVKIRPSKQTNKGRNKKIIRDRKAGMTLQAVADKHNVTKQRVHAIVSRGY